VVSDLGSAFDQPLDLLELSYQNRLRVIGRFIDELELHSVTLIEVNGGFVLRASRAGEPWPVVIELDDRKVSELMRQAIQARGEGDQERESRELLPTGYEDTFRALGFGLDQRIAESIVVAELPSLFAVSGFEPVVTPGVGETTYRPFAEAMGPGEVTGALRLAIARRGSYQNINRYIPPNFRG
jgi:hypothetical protein